MQMFILRTLATAAALLSASVGSAADRDAKWTRGEHAHYKIQQFGDSVVLVAYGTHPTAGYQARLRRLPIEIYPPEFEFLEQKPGGFSAQVITPFAEIAHFKASGIVKSVVIHDAKGKRAVKLTAYASDSGIPEKRRRYLTPDGKLAARLVFKDAQSGFAGMTGYFFKSIITELNF